MESRGAIERALVAARPQAMGALLRYFRNLDTAEDAFQEASLRALRNWPDKGLPRDPAAWLIFVGRNAALDAVRRDARSTALPPEETLSDLEDREAALVEALDAGQLSGRPSEAAVRLLPPGAAGQPADRAGAAGSSPAFR